MLFFFLLHSMYNIYVRTYEKYRNDFWDKWDVRIICTVRTYIWETIRTYVRQHDWWILISIHSSRAWYGMKVNIHIPKEIHMHPSFLKQHYFSTYSLHPSIHLSINPICFVNQIEVIDPNMLKWQLQINLFDIIMISCSGSFSLVMYHSIIYNFLFSFRTFFFYLPVVAWIEGKIKNSKAHWI